MRTSPQIFLVNWVGKSGTVGKPGLAQLVIRGPAASDFRWRHKQSVTTRISMEPAFMNGAIVTTRCNRCGAPLQISPGGKQICRCGSLVAGPHPASSEQKSTVSPSAQLPWWFLLLVLGIVLAGVAIALATMEHGGSMYIVLVTGLLVLVVTVTFLVIRETHKPIEVEPEEVPMSSSATFVAALRQAAAEAESRNALQTQAALAADTRSTTATIDLERKVPLPFDAYQGAEPFLFASYAHQDAAEVYPEIGRLHLLGYRVWYDEGICPGREWPEAVADALKHASFFLVFISPRALASSNVRNEINLALKKKKPFLAIHLEETELPGGVELQIGSLQAILKYLGDEERYHRRLEVSLPAELRARV
jgi:hypothetical protein